MSHQHCKTLKGSRILCQFRISNERFSKVIIQVDYTSCFQHPLLSLEGLFKHGVKSYFFFLFSVPQPVILFPLNAEYRTRDIKDRTAPGIPSGVSLAPGPYGEEDGSYEFFGNTSSFIEFPNSPGGALDVRYSMTILCWVYYDEKGGPRGPIFEYNTGGNDGVYLWVGKRLFSASFIDRALSYSRSYLRHTSSARGWKFVGASYDHETGEIKLWADGAFKQTGTMRAGVDLRTQGSVRMGVRKNGKRCFKGKISQLQIYNEALSQQQILKLETKPKGENLTQLCQYLLGITTRGRLLKA